MAAQQKNVWAFRFTTLSLVLIPVAVGINYVGKLFAAALKLPLWLDSIGTVLAGMLAGPWIGAISGAVNNIIFGITADPVSFWYLITSIVIGLVVGYLAMTGWIRDFGRAVLLGLIVALAAAVVSTPINVILWEGTTSNVWGDALYTILRDQGTPVWIASFIDELVVDLLDKVATVIVSFLIFKALPQRLTGLFAGQDQVEKL
ncbi:energy-coupling factor transport system substrate-specific component [Symbiobacterium terraclitae]|uniref:Energy-coupling factor transport system substrate-specific component n=1 Tax=Symbiobacterium terraclitae TaxID=557451 RepID=A0ABS4JRN3_9FIRM|nr:ECF transporter S component [Symbiobacterium terraclitae]MBP2018187.1 energy-coupling factor transport system substrate-specific component [Symbiobacterium terraclitae]